MIFPRSFYAIPAGGTAETVRLVGRNADIDTASVPESVWTGGGAFSFLAAAEGLTAVSANANDTADPNGEPPAPGTGARTVTITGLSSAYAVVSEVVSLDGTTAAATVADFLRVNGFEVTTAGSSVQNVGAVTLAGADTTTATLAVIPAGENIAQQTHYTVPAGKRAYIVAVRASATNASASLLVANLRVREFGSVWKIVLPIAFSADVPYESRFELPIEVGGKADLELRVTSVSANDNVVAAEIDLVVVG